MKRRSVKITMFPIGRVVIACLEGIFLGEAIFREEERLSLLGLYAYLPFIGEFISCGIKICSA
jgi:hypothetical protein